VQLDFQQNKLLKGMKKGKRISRKWVHFFVTGDLIYILYTWRTMVTMGFAPLEKSLDAFALKSLIFGTINFGFGSTRKKPLDVCQ